MHVVSIEDELVLVVSYLGGAVVVVAAAVVLVDVSVVLVDVSAGRVLVAKLDVSPS